MSKCERFAGMRIDVITAFPNILGLPLSQSIVGRAQKKGIVDIHTVDPRDFTSDNHRTIDEIPYGGGPGMVLKPEPIYSAVDFLLSEISGDPRIIITTPRGQQFDQKAADRFANEENLIFICGHYRGMDERIFELATDEMSIGDFVVTGGEIPAMLMIDAIVRRIPGSLNDFESAERDSFAQSNLLGEPLYTRPEIFREMRVPEILLSGHHQKIEEWRKEQRLELTKTKREELLTIE
ncbi:MAG: tRNA (guanosine(37)-N1)-methyltransferase TrmD [Candidatus Marinimicrobia bacterium]|nr:tRNA (guanosine(37)-N1)-methyltransferase TrmD [Candidatus Neomarinimicrobiota bacterium]